MTYQLPIITTPQLESQTAPAAVDSIRIQALEALSKSLEVGTYLNVKVSIDRKGDPSIILYGQRFLAELPEEAKDGQQLLVKVLSTKEPLLLQVVTNKEVPKDLLRSREALPDLPSALKQFVETLLSKESIKNIEDSVKLLGRDIPAKLQLSAPEKPDLTSLIPAKPGNTPALLKPNTEKEIIKLLETLSDKALLLPEKELKEAKSLANLLPKLLSAPAAESLRQLKALNNDLSKLQPNATETRLINALDEALKAILANTQELSFESTQPVTPEQSSKQIRLYTESSLLLMQRGDGKALEQLSKGLQKLDLKSNPLVMLMQSLGWANFTEPTQSGTSSQELTQLIKSFLNDLKQLREMRATDKDLRPALQKFSEKINSKAQQNAQGEALSKFEETWQGLKALESALSAREGLSNMNPLISALGHSPLHLIPSLIDGNLLNWRVSFGRPELDNEQQKNAGQNKGNKGYEKIDLELALPHLGNISVTLARKDQEVLVQLSSPEQSICEFIKGSLPELEKNLKDAGAEQVQLLAAQREFSISLPEWYEEFVRKSIVA